MRHWLRSYWLLLRWQLLRQRTFVPFAVTVQTVMAVGIVLGFSFLIPEHDDETVRYLATGAPTLALVTMGMAMVPQLVAQQKLRGLFDYHRAMPVPRLALLAADATVWVTVALPGMLAAVAVAALWFDLSFTVSPLVVPAVLLVALVTVAIGYGIGYATRPELTGLVTNLVLFFALMFSPVNFPADRLPDWLATVHQWLPFQYLAQAIRETVDTPATGVPVLPFLVLAGWGVASLTLAYFLMSRRA